MEKYNFSYKIVQKHPKANHIFTIFGIDSFYPSIMEKLLTNA